MIDKEEKEFVEIFINYFNARPLASYMDFCKMYSENKPINKFILRKRVDTIRKKLQRKGIMSCTKINDANGRFYSQKNINHENLYLEYEIKIDN